MGAVYGKTIFLRHVPEETYRLAHAAQGMSEHNDLRSWIFNAVHEQALRQMGEEGLKATMKMIDTQIKQESKAPAKAGKK